MVKSYVCPSFPLIRKSFFSQRPIQRAFLYSLLLHAIILGIFRIKALSFDRTDATPYISSLLIDLQPSTAEKEKNESFSLTLPPSYIAGEPLSLDPPTLQPINSDTFFFPPIPLHVHFSKNIKALNLLHDGTHLFIGKKEALNTKRFDLPLQSHDITYTIIISGRTGQITQWKRKHELLDKKLQNFADTFLSYIDFQPFEGEVRGKIKLSFFVDGEEMYEILR